MRREIELYYPDGKVDSFNVFEGDYGIEENGSIWIKRKTGFFATETIRFSGTWKIVEY